MPNEIFISTGLRVSAALLNPTRLQDSVRIDETKTRRRTGRLSLDLLPNEIFICMNPDGVLYFHYGFKSAALTLKPARGGLQININIDNGLP